MGRRRGAVIGGAALGFGLTLALAGCASPGDRAATRTLHEIENSLFREAQQNWRRGDDPAWLAIWAANDSGVRQEQDCVTPATTVRVEPLSWSSPDGLVGQVELHVVVVTGPFRSCGFGQSGYGPGRAEECVRFVVGTTDDSSIEIDCDGRQPVPAPASASKRDWPSGQPPGG